MLIRRAILNSVDDTFQTLVSCLFDAAWDPGHWPNFLEKVGNAVGSVCTTLYCEDSASQKGSLSVSFDTNTGDAGFYKSISHRKAHKHNPFAEDARLSAFIVKPGQQVVAVDFHDDWLLGALVLREESIKANLVCLRPEKAGRFGDMERALVQRLTPYLKQALLLHLRLRGIVVMQDAVSQLLNRLAIGILLVDCKGRLLSANRHAAAILKQKDGFYTSGSELRLWRHDELKQLLSGILKIAPCMNADRTPAVHVMRVSRNSGARDFSVMASPLTTDLQLTEKECVLALFVYDPDEEISASEKSLKELYGLTAAESRLVKLLLQGKTLEEIAGTLDLSMSTIRTQIRSIFAKTNTTRQADLIRVLLRSPLTQNDPARD